MWPYYKRIGALVWLVLLGMCQATSATTQDITITDFERRVTDLTASVRPEFDYTGEACAVIRFSVRDTTFIVEGNLGVVKRETTVGEILLWVPQGTKRLTVRHEGLLTLKNYEIPVEIVSKGAYHAVLLATREPEPPQALKDSVGPTPEPPQPPAVEVPHTTKVELSAGYNVLPIVGPSASFGLDINHHVIEIGGTYGIKDSDTFFFYSKGTMVGGYRYRNLRADICYGYDIKPASLLGIMPKIGFAMNYITSVPDNLNTSNGGIRKVTTASALGALRLSLCLGKSFKLHVTPEYDFVVHHTENGKILAEYSGTMKKWSEGFSLNTGLIVCL